MRHASFGILVAITTVAPAAHAQHVAVETSAEVSQPAEASGSSRPSIDNERPPALAVHRRRPGEEIGPGSHVTRRIRWGLAAGGAALFVAAYAATLPVTLTTGLEYNAIPVIGPFAVAVETFSAVGSYAGSCTSSSLCQLGSLLGVVAGGALLIDSLVQAGGIAMVVIGLATRDQWVVPDEAMRRESAVRWMLAPGAPGAALGATVTVMNF